MENITAKIIADSISEAGKRITTFELEYPRFLHSETMTHRMLSKNCASSRAIRFEDMIANVRANTAMPVWWGKNQPGMQAREEVEDIESCKASWLEARDTAIASAEKLFRLGVHKQIVNRIVEPFCIIKTVLTGTDFNNLYALRDHEDAQPEFAHLAKKMRLAQKNSEPELLKVGEWHIPYAEKHLDLQTRLKVSASLCAQVSYRKSDDSVEKALKIYERLTKSYPIHASVFEHQAQALPDANMRSGNFYGWYQYRQSIPNNVVLG